MTQKEVDLIRNTVIMARLLRAATYVIAALIGLILFFFGPRIEVLLYPVIGSFDITKTEVVDGHLQISGVMYKNRGECEPQALVMEVFNTDDNAKVLLIDEDINDGQPYDETIIRHRPSGAQEWGPWEINTPVPPLGAVTRIVITHKCHFIWSTEQIIYEGPTSDIFSEDIMKGIY